MLNLNLRHHTLADAAKESECIFSRSDISKVESSMLYEVKQSRLEVLLARRMPKCIPATCYTLSTCKLNVQAPSGLRWKRCSPGSPDLINPWKRVKPYCPYAGFRFLSFDAAWEKGVRIFVSFLLGFDPRKENMIPGFNFLVLIPIKTNLGFMLFCFYLFCFGWKSHLWCD